MLLVACAPLFALEGQADLWHPSRVVDEADLLTADEEESLLGYIDEMEKEKNVIFLGRLAKYKYYNMDAIVAQSLALADKLLWGVVGAVLTWFLARMGI